MRVLVVDDHALFRDGITSLLNAAGIDVVGEAGGGQAAVEKALELRPDLVLMDHCLPDMSVLQALCAIKKNLPKTKVVMLTIAEGDEEVSKAIEAGADGYVLKNLNPGEFVDMLDGLQETEDSLIRNTAAQLLRKGRSSNPNLPNR